MKICGRFLIACVLLTGFYCTISAQTESPKSSHGGREINWVFPGHFEDAKTLSKEKNQIIIIKGLGFGLDQVGATCATKGDW
jgi:hypothetical protein